MNLWHISQTVNDGYDTYSDAVVAAETMEEARMMHPQDGASIAGLKIEDEYNALFTWAESKDVKVEWIGTAAAGTKKGVICASFHAG